MQTIKFCGEEFPLSYVNSVSYATSANCREGARFKLYFRGYNVTEINISMHITQAVCDEPLSDVLKQFLAMPLNGKGYSVQVGEELICEHLLFALTQLGITPAADVRGIISAFDLSITLSCTAIAKSITFDTDKAQTLPAITVSLGNNSISVGEGVSISGLTLSPTDGELILVIGEGLQKIDSSAWLNRLVEEGGAVDVEGYGSFYISNGSMQIGNELYLELSAFSEQETTPNTISLKDTTIKAAISRIMPRVEYFAKDIDCSYIYSEKSPLETVNEIIKSAGLLLSYRGNKLQIHELPETLAGAQALDVFVNDDVVSAKTSKVVIYDGEHKYVEGAGVNVQQIKSAFCTSTNRAGELLKYINYKQSLITVSMPYNSSIRQYSAVFVHFGDQTLGGLVDSYKIDFISGNIELVICLIEGRKYE